MTFVSPRLVHSMLGRGVPQWLLENGDTKRGGSGTQFFVFRIGCGDGAPGVRFCSLVRLGRAFGVRPTVKLRVIRGVMGVVDRKLPTHDSRGVAYAARSYRPLNPQPDTLV